jgi:hypothetical protein
MSTLPQAQELPSSPPAPGAPCGTAQPHPAALAGRTSAGPSDPPPSAAGQRLPPPAWPPPPASACEEHAGAEVGALVELPRFPYTRSTLGQLPQLRLPIRAAISVFGLAHGVVEALPAPITGVRVVVEVLGEGGLGRGGGGEGGAAFPAELHFSQRGTGVAASLACCDALCRAVLGYERRGLRRLAGERRVALVVARLGLSLPAATTPPLPPPSTVRCWRAIG